jgi:hypothetical protein
VWQEIEAQAQAQNIKFDTLRDRDKQAGQAKDQKFLADGGNR